MNQKNLLVTVHSPLLVTTLRRGNAYPDSLRLSCRPTQSVESCIPTQSIGTRGVNEGGERFVSLSYSV